jgi:hypothetical protein
MQLIVPKKHQVEELSWMKLQIQTQQLQQCFQIHKRKVVELVEELVPKLPYDAADDRTCCLTPTILLWIGEPGFLFIKHQHHTHTHKKRKKKKNGNISTGRITFYFFYKRKHPNKKKGNLIYTFIINPNSILKKMKGKKKKKNIWESQDFFKNFFIFFSHTRKEVI